MNKNIEFEFGFYTPGTCRARLIEGSNAIREGKAPELKRKIRNERRQPKKEAPAPVQPNRDRPAYSALIISGSSRLAVKPVEKEIANVNVPNVPPPWVSLPRKGVVNITSPRVNIQCHADEKERIEVRKREILIRERLSDDKSKSQHKWNLALLSLLDAALVCL